MKLRDKVAVVTGGANGIGFGIAQVLVQEGARVALVDLDEQRGVEAATELNRVGDQNIFVPADVSKVDDIQKAVEACLAQYGHIDILCNNAAIRKIHKVVDMPVEVWDRVLNTNLRGPLLLAKHALPHMKTGGSIINISSTSATSAEIGKVAYCCSKAALVMLTKILALECAEAGIRANCVVLGGGFATPMFYEAGASPEKAALKNPLKRIGEVEEVGKVVAFMASADSSFITGSVLVMDGGATAGRN
jgi:NAD(P)-dependent dehydrogenase (short-subunit alcohol dehydrogenase family)